MWYNHSIVRDVGQWLGRLVWDEDIFASSSLAIPTKFLGCWTSLQWSPTSDVGERGLKSRTPDHFSQDVAQFGSVLARDARGRRFKSCHPDQFI